MFCRSDIAKRIVDQGARHPDLLWFLCGLLMKLLAGDNKENMKRKMGYCGNNCDYCPLYIATQSGDKGELTRVAILWHKVRARHQILPPEEMVCNGCTPDKTCPFGIIKCASEKNGKQLQRMF